MRLCKGLAVDPLMLATQIAREAGALLMTYYGGPLQIESKSVRNDLVTQADRASEALIVRRLREIFPDSSILGEETGMHHGTNGQRWIVDPLDGTTNFAHGYPPFCVSIGYEEDGKLAAGVIYAPKLDECFSARRGCGATLNGAPIRVSTIATLADSLACTGFAPRYRERNLPEFAMMMDLVHAVRRDGSAALDLAYVAAGRFDCFWEFGLHAWDIAAGALIIREAGGRVSGIDGTALVIEGEHIMATNAHVHDEMVAVFRERVTPL